jgi:hypothetical protein
MTGCQALRLTNEAAEIKKSIQELKEAVEKREHSACPLPANLQPPNVNLPDNKPCFYALTVTNNSVGNRQIKAKVSDRALTRIRKDVNVDYPPFANRPEFTFVVRVPGGVTLQNNTDYDFFGVEGTRELSCEAPCDPRTADLP